MVTEVGVGSGGERLPSMSMYAYEQLRSGMLDTVISQHLTENDQTFRLPGIADDQQLWRMASAVCQDSLVDYTDDASHAFMQGLQLAYFLEIPRTPAGRYPGLPLARFSSIPSPDYTQWLARSYDALVCEDTTPLQEYDVWRRHLPPHAAASQAAYLGYATAKVLLREHTLVQADQDLLAQEQRQNDGTFLCLVAPMQWERDVKWKHFEKFMYRTLGAEFENALERDQYQAMVARILAHTVSTLDDQTRELDTMLDRPQKEIRVARRPSRRKK